MPLESENREITALLATLGAQLTATNQRLDTLFNEVAAIGALLRDQDGLLIRVDRLETSHGTFKGLPARVDQLEHWQRAESQKQSQQQQSSENLKSRLFYPLILALILATLGLAWALLTHQTAIAPVPALPAVTPHIIVHVLRTTEVTLATCAGIL